MTRIRTDGRSAHISAAQVCVACFPVVRWILGEDLQLLLLGRCAQIVHRCGAIRSAGVIIFAVLVVVHAIGQQHERGPDARKTGPPVTAQDDEIGNAHLTIAVQISRMTRIRTPSAQQNSLVAHADLSVTVKVALAGVAEITGEAVCQPNPAIIEVSGEIAVDEGPFIHRELTDHHLQVRVRFCLAVERINVVPVTDRMAVGVEFKRVPVG